MPQASIEINAIVASDEDLPINTLVQLSNDDAGDESTYSWEIVSQPSGSGADVLSNAAIENPTITPTVEGAYLFKLTVDLGLATEVIDKKLFRIRTLRTDMGMPAAEETTEADSDEGWKTTLNNILSFVDSRVFGGEVIVGVADAGLSQGDVVQITARTAINSGLPGEVYLPAFDVIDATDANVLTYPLAVVIGSPQLATTVALGDVVLVRFSGLYSPTLTGSPTVGDPVYVNDSGVLGLTVGTNTRQVGVVADASGGSYWAFISR